MKATLTESITTQSGVRRTITFREPTLSSARKWMAKFMKTFPFNQYMASATYTIFDGNGRQLQQVTLTK